MTTRLLIMAKAPVPGEVKTRLRLAPLKAAALQAALVRDTVEKARSLRLGPVTVAYAPPDGRALVEPLLSTFAGTRLAAQSGGDLGERMLAAAVSLFAQSAGPVLILGTDAPTLPRKSILRAAEALGEGPYDASIIGSDDGGYVLLGLKGPHEELFRGIEWSTGSVYQTTLEKARANKLFIHEGEPHYDVDTQKDLARLRKELSADPELAPYTAKLLTNL